MRALLTLAAFIACAAWPAASQDSSTEAPDVATDEPPPPAAGTTPPPPPGINPNHSYYPPSYRPHFNGYNPNSYWNRYPSHGYYPSRPWSYRPPAYHPPPTTYEWWKQFNRRPSFEHGGWSGVGGGYDSSPSPNGYGYWQPYYVAVGYYRRSSYAPSPPIASRGSDSYGAAYPYIMGYDKFGYPYYRSSNYGGGLYGSSIGYGGYSGSYSPSYYGSYAPSYPGAYPYSYPSYHGYSPSGYGSSAPSYQGSYPYSNQGSYPAAGGSHGVYPYYASHGSYPYSGGYPYYGSYSYYGSAHGGQPQHASGYPYHGNGHGSYSGGQIGPSSYYPVNYGSYQGYGYGYGYPYYSYGSGYNYGSGGYSTGKYSGGGLYPNGNHYHRYYPDYNRNYYSGTNRGWYECTYYPTAVNKGYTLSGSEGVKQKVDVSKQNADKITKTFTRRSIRDLLKSSEDASQDAKRANSRGPIYDLSNDGLGAGMLLLGDGSAPKKDLQATDGVFQAADKATPSKVDFLSQVFGLDSNGSDQRITAEMVETFERRMTAMNRMFEELLTPKDIQDNGDYFARRVRAYRKLINQIQQRGTVDDGSPNEVDPQETLERLRTIERELDDRRRRALRTLYHALTDSDLTVSDKLKVLATVYKFAKEGISEETVEASETTEKGSASSEKDVSATLNEDRSSMSDESTKDFYDRLEKVVEMIRNAGRAASDEGAVDPSKSSSASASDSSSSESSSSESSSSESSDSGEKAKFELKGSVSLAVNVQGRSDMGTNTINNFMKAMLS
ncbi:uncharacterized protein LOC144170395 [Haemaphysalis longicornis]